MILTPVDITNSVRLFLKQHLASPVAEFAVNDMIQITVNRLVSDLRLRSIVEVEAEYPTAETLNIPNIVEVDYDSLTLETTKDQTLSPRPLSDFLILTNFGNTLILHILRLIESLDSGLACNTIGIQAEDNNIATIFFLTTIMSKEDGSNNLAFEVRRTVAERNLTYQLPPVDPGTEFDLEGFSAECNAKLIQQILKSARREDVVIDSYLMLMRYRTLLVSKTRRGVPNLILVHPNNFNTLLSLFTYQRNGLGVSLLQRHHSGDSIKMLSSLEVPEGKILIGYRGNKSFDSRHFIDVTYNPVSGTVNYAIVDVGVTDSLEPYWIIGDLPA